MENNLDSFFKKHLLDESSNEDVWDIPPEGVWDKIDPEIQKSRVVLIPVKYLYIIGTAFVVGLAVGFLIWNNQNTDTANTDNGIVSEKIEYAYLNQIPFPLMPAESKRIENKDIGGVDYKTRFVKETQYTAGIALNKPERNIHSGMEKEFVIINPIANTNEKTIQDGTSMKRLSNQFEIPIYMEVISPQLITFLSNSINKQISKKLRVIQSWTNDTSQIHTPNFGW